MSDTNYSFTEKYIDHEVRVRMLENAIAKIDERFKKIDERFNKIDDKFAQVHRDMLDMMKQNFNFFLTTVGVILALFGGMIISKIFS